MVKCFLSHKIYDILSDNYCGITIYIRFFWSTCWFILINNQYVYYLTCRMHVQFTLLNDLWCIHTKQRDVNNLTCDIISEAFNSENIPN